MNPTPNIEPSKFTRVIFREFLSGICTLIALLGLFLLAVFLFPALRSLLEGLDLTAENTVWLVLGLTAFGLTLIGVFGSARLRVEPLSIGSAILGAFVLAIAAIGLITWVSLRFMGMPPIDRPELLTFGQLNTVTTRAFAAVAGLGGVAFLVIAFRKQRTTELSENRDEVRLFDERYRSASDQLGSEEAVVRLAGVHALAQLADDAPTDREDLVQMVINLLCGYVHMPRSSASETHQGREAHEVSDYEKREERIISAILAAISSRLRMPAHRWQGKEFDFRGARLPRVSMSHLRLHEVNMNFEGASFEGTVDFSYCSFRGSYISLKNCTLHSHASFENSQITSGRVILSGAHFTNAPGTEMQKLSFANARIKGKNLALSLIKVSIWLYADFRYTRFSGFSLSLPFDSSKIAFDFRDARGVAPEVRHKPNLMSEMRDFWHVPEAWIPSVDNGRVAGDTKGI
ncbi:pentapeptide repeat-containing protein [Nocardiopsis sp. JB363]|uniref:pentapeptide repeat-containing protein n=1 Tax=Nocardiopsis sp. JB363 TaxID=1434837 RepID=UPI00135BD59D|nr:pentapeptide repeat-containing protein [Nocardiopsis sp. JB363]